MPQPLSTDLQVDVDRPDPAHLPQLLDVGAAAEFLGLTVRHLRDLQYHHEVPHVRIGRRVLFRPADLVEWIDEHTVEVSS